MKHELEWTDEITKYLREQLACIVKVEFSASRYQQAGWPDRWLCCPIWTGWLEFKGENTRVELLQIERMKEIWIRNPGGVYVVRHGINRAPHTIRCHWSGVVETYWKEPEELLLGLANLTNTHREAYAVSISEGIKKTCETYTARLSGILKQADAQYTPKRKT